MTPASPLKVAQITDTHLFAELDRQWKGISTTRTLQAVLDRLQQIQPPPDLLLLTGDLSQDETPESYQRLVSLIAPLGIPAYWIPGNHDNIGVMAEILKGPPISPQKSWMLGNWQFLLLSSVEAGCDGGRLSPESLQWLDSQLQQTGDRPVTIALHHHALPIDCEIMDSMMLHNAGEFFAIVDRYPQIKIVLSGHIHQEFQQQRGSVTYLGTPSTCIQLLPKSHPIILDEIPPGFRLLELAIDGTWTTKIERVAAEPATA
ncbi:MAG: 3',5'-cyclic-AMP phosphodiesterase [Microcoleus sp. PH2017_10_PVI_O_A]|nr:3',5'-cyclic-AMP phosphodiesterase [Microcoleus sp. PH2017_10_PVI_O_A]MCC3464104.1 3',5'-cyclic-AMP phosphodiesterase [Microcoleus sp. PH2017_11_PCY_U_A]MCC3482418.1 3',5'-cyclic-AMP phosphodiesterase [Microcoleus sp. PH2017_12_PCY_D_A]MCC3529934.1 3',5'-cyclic-AMP phosphodiesterase [Microcoleus sp. PH2017_21_RUC_O_A]MCC3542228.1 3',5'-cyclic-AMP phosphodiesterase [Microcoleus sp. PH2017_22_RUC_O_B]MCC3563427.1 3',5'-cyclic-AMP phosphodiesterase [Microcoleus sp. PH2017_27_LUM_O_A]TAE74003.